MPADSICSEGNIHELAFISSLIIRKEIWDISSHTTHYFTAQLYAHVFCILDGLRRNNLGILRVCEHAILSGYGRNEYYMSKTAVARLSEFATFDQIAYRLSPESKSRLLVSYTKSNYRRLRLDCASALKIGAFRHTYYKHHISLIRRPLSPFVLSRVACKAIYLLTSIPLIASLLRSAYSFQSKGKVLSDVDAEV
jgi:hypothetical protein